jgi:hypothetical protein
MKEESKCSELLISPKKKKQSRIKNEMKKGGKRK